MLRAVADRVVSDLELRHAIFREHNDEDLALAETAHSEANRYDGFWGWDAAGGG
jgi:hypothetical protein